MRFLLLMAVGLGTLIWAAIPSQAMKNGGDLMTDKPQNYPTAILAGGCFWCLESEFRAIDGILYTRVGYTGGHVENPTYRQVTTGKTGHAEAVEITYDPDKVSYEFLLKFFLSKAHNPTTKDRQGVDVGPQYRSVIYYQNDSEKEMAEKMIHYVNMNKVWRDPIVTEVEPVQVFYEGEDYHQQYYEKYQEKTGREHIRVQLKKLKKL